MFDGPQVELHMFGSYDAAKGVVINAGLDAAKTYVNTQVTAITGQSTSLDMLIGVFKVGDADDKILDSLAAATAAAGKTLADLRLGAAIGAALKPIIQIVPPVVTPPVVTPPVVTPPVVTPPVSVGVSSAVFNAAKTYGTMTDQDGNIYKTITIGGQTWMAENLRVTKYRNGDPIPNTTDNAAWIASTSGAYSSYGNTTNRDDIATHGLLYNWFATSDSRNIAPTGWRLPTDGEWITLTTYLGSITAGGQMKEAGTSHWASPNTGATNDSGFTSLPSGARTLPDGTFLLLGTRSYYWSSTMYGPTGAWYRSMTSTDSVASALSFNFQAGYSVRLIKE